MSQFPQGLGFDLPDAFAGDFEVLSDFFQGVICGFADTKPLAQHLFLTRRQGFQSAVDLPLQVIANGRFQRRHGLLVFDEIAQMAVFFFTDRRFERDGLAGNFENFPELCPTADPCARRSLREAAHDQASARDAGRFE